MIFTFFFWLFAALTLGSAVAVICNRNPVASALCMVVSMLGLAALYITLDAGFLGVIQALVYAGAVMVLFLFIIMLLDLKSEKARRFRPASLGGGLLVALGFTGLLVSVLHRYHDGARVVTPLSGSLEDAKLLGKTLFTHFSFPIQVIGILLLVASVGVVLLSNRELK